MVKDKKSKSKIIRIAVFVLGFVLCSYPLFSGIMEGYTQRNAVSTYNSSVEKLDEDKIKEALKDAEKYNSLLYQTMGALVGNSGEVLNHENYEKLLNVTGTGVMGTIEIPKINVDLPIYHGTSDEVLSRGVGHVEETSLPVGGKNTRSVITGHRGLPTSKLFTRLDELKKGDLFYIRVCGQTLAYQINDIQEIKPEEVDKLEIEPDQDLVSLITCTPYGINTHRLVVTGERVDYSEAEHNMIEGKMMSLREIFFTAIPFVFLIYAVYQFLKVRKEKKAKNENKTEI